MLSGYVDSDEAAKEKSQQISLAFGGSGYNKPGNGPSDDDVPALLAAPVKLIDHSGLKPSTKSYGATFMASSHSETSSSSAIHVNSNTQLDITAIPTTQKQYRKMKKENEQLQRILELEALEREREAAEIAIARMMAIKASRALGRKSLTGSHIAFRLRFSQLILVLIF